MATLRKCAPWLFKEEFHRVTPSEAEAVENLFATLSPEDAQKQATCSISARGFLPLQRVAHNGYGPHSIDVFRAIFNAYPSAATKKDINGYLPLHIVAQFMSDDDRHGGGLEAVRLLLTEYPQAAMQKNNDGNLPIHRICLNEKATLAMVRELLSAYPNAIKERGSDHRKVCKLALDKNRLPADAVEFLRRAEQGQCQGV